MPGNASQPSIFTPREQLTSVPSIPTHTTTSSSSSTTSIAARQQPPTTSPIAERATSRTTEHKRILSDVGPNPWRAVSGREEAEQREQTRSSSFSEPRPIFQTPSTPSSANRKRPLDSADLAPASEQLFKKSRLKPRPKYELDSFSLLSAPITSISESASFLDQETTPPSPLFFSHSPRPRPYLPPRFSSSEAGAKMLSKARLEESHVKTVSLARGTISTPHFQSSSPGISTSAVRRSLERSTTGRSHSPESSNGREIIGANASAHLSSIGITELLEQDDRPTFVVDLSTSSNYGPGPLHPLFTNLSLRSVDGLLEFVAGTASGEHSPDATTFIQFKSWVLSATINGESLNVCLPPFTYAGMSWSCSTLRKRLRIISGVFTQGSQIRPDLLRATASTSELPLALSSAHASIPEAADYFGPPSATINRPPTTTSAGVVNSIEKVGHRTPSPTAMFTIVQRDLAAGEYVATPSTTQMAGSSAQISPDITGYIDNVHDAIDLQMEDLPSFDWTMIPVSDSMPPHIQFARSVDWASTALGPIEHWAPDLRRMANLIMASPMPSAFYWGEDLVAIYNEAYVLLAGQKHPKLMGQSYRVAWAEIWDDVKDVFASAKSTGEATMKDDDCLFITRNNYLEETYFSWSIIPMLGDDGSVMGLYNPAFEKTRRTIAERRMLTLREVGERTAAARDVKAFWAQVLDSFEFNEYDSPFLLLYSVGDESDSDGSSIHSNSIFSPRACTLEGALGIPDGHPAAPESIDMRTGTEGFMPAFREVMKTDKPIVLELGNKDLPDHLLEGLDLRGFGDPVRAVVVCPIHPTTGESVLGFLVLGVNPRRPYDDDYSLFVQLLSRQLATSLASVVLFEEEIRRGQKAAKLAALDRIELSEQLAARTKEAIESETKFTRMAEFAPVGMFIAASNGRITFANDTWYEISRLSKDTSHTDKWIECVKPEDRDIVEQMWSDLESGTKNVSREIRFKAQWVDRNNTRNDTWVLFSAYPEKHEDGRLKSVFGSITNISQQKWAEGLQTRKMEEAMELKRQQENFIDITSHEMRNPLSAILQCADEITNSLTRLKNDGKVDAVNEVIQSCLEAAQTISLCSQHQKRIVDDVLTLSKLDSQLLLVTPVDAQPLTVVQRALKMHEGELSAADIQMKFVVDKSFKDLALDWLRFDPSRVLQVLINLTTNAIKFTTTEKKRTITVSIAASTQRPSELTNTPVQYFPTRNKRRDSLQEQDWGEGEKVFVQFAVQDTGRGLSPDEKKLLFIRFSQASPRTHVQYGGSGLGLFISRELTELQGGEIGVASEAGQGSTFAFYIAARRSNAPLEGDPASAMMQRYAAGSRAKQSTTNGKDEQMSTPREVVRRVLIVEDNLVNQKVLQKQLKSMGTEVHVANHGGEALEKLKQSTYWAEGGGGKRLELGVVLMDQEMPVMDGLTCTRKIREFEKQGKLTGHVPIIAVTANARVEQIQTALNAGMDDVVSKPFRIPDLMPKIEDLLQRYPTPPV